MHNYRITPAEDRPQFKGASLRAGVRGMDHDAAVGLVAQSQHVQERLPVPAVGGAVGRHRQYLVSPVVREERVRVPARLLDDARRGEDEFLLRPARINPIKDYFRPRGATRGLLFPSWCSARCVSSSSLQNPAACRDSGAGQGTEGRV